jgi:hypothetical protein
VSGRPPETAPRKPSSLNISRALKIRLAHFPSRDSSAGTTMVRTHSDTEPARRPGTEPAGGGGGVQTLPAQGREREGVLARAYPLSTTPVTGHELK